MMPVSLYRALGGLLRRDLLLAYRHRGDIANPLVFALMVIALFPIGLGPERASLAVLAPGLVWVVALLACLLSVDTMFRADYEDGSLEQILLSPHSPYLLSLTKIFAHWLVAGLPIALLSPLLAMMLSLPAEGYIALFFSLLIGTLSLSLIGAIGAALTVGLKRGGLLVALLVLPLYIPVLIFGVSTVHAAVQGMAYSGYLAILGALSLFALMLAPLAVSGGLKIHLEG
ncbi:MAG: heme exporter protein CcmB [Pseudomonadales bacterium]